jgi:hypothetical protein
MKSNNDNEPINLSSLKDNEITQASADDNLNDKTYITTEYLLEIERKE